MLWEFHFSLFDTMYLSMHKPYVDFESLCIELLVNIYLYNLSIYNYLIQKVKIGNQSTLNVDMHRIFKYFFVVNKNEFINETHNYIKSRDAK